MRRHRGEGARGAVKAGSEWPRGMRYSIVPEVDRKWYKYTCRWGCRDEARAEREKTVKVVQLVQGCCLQRRKGLGNKRVVETAVIALGDMAT